MYIFLLKSIAWWFKSKHLERSNQRVALNDQTSSWEDMLSNLSPFTYALKTISYKTLQQKILFNPNNIIMLQGRSEGTSSVAFEVLIINCQIYFINLFIFNCLTLNIKLFIFQLFDVKFLFSKNHLFRKHNLWTHVLSFGF